MIRGTKRSLPNGGRIIEPKVTNINVPINASLHNRFDIEVVDAKTGEVKQRAQAENVICNQLWTRLFTPAIYWANVHYGTGTGTPDVTDTSLFSFFASLVSLESVFDTSQMKSSSVYSLKQKYQIAENAAVGQTITEVGIAYGAAASNLCTHAMLKDMNGNQISIAKTDTDLINIYATVFVHFSVLGYDTGHISLIKFLHLFVNETVHGVFFRWCAGLQAPNSTIYSYGLFPIGCINSPMISDLFKPITPTYNASTKTLTLTGARTPINEINQIGGSQCVRIVDRSLASPIHSANSGHLLTLYVGGNWFQGTQILSEAVGTGDGVTKDFITMFNYAATASIYIDGLLNSNVVVENIPHRIVNALDGFSVLLFDINVRGAGYYNCSPIMYSSFSIPESLLNNQYGSPEMQESIFENRLSEYGVSSLTCNSYVTGIECSNDLTTWFNIPVFTNIPAEHRNKRYWKILSTNGESGVLGRVGKVTAAAFDTPPPATNIHFDVAPPVGAVITADYFTKTIAKDSNHVFDLTVTIQLGEYTET